MARSIHRIAITFLSGLCVGLFALAWPESRAEADDHLLSPSGPADPSIVGGIVDGGGAGVACFQPMDFKTGEWQENIVPLAMDPHGRIKRDYLHRVFFVSLLELDEAIHPRGDFPELSSPGFLNGIASIEPLAHESDDEYVARIVDEHVARLSPRFAYHLRNALHATRPASWIAAPHGLALTSDRGTGPGFEAFKTERGLRKHCAFVQIAKRADVMPPTFRYEPNVASITYDPDLYERLWFRQDQGPDAIKNLRIQKNSLHFHEALYGLGVQLGHRNSKPARALTRLLLTDGNARRIGSNFNFLLALDSLGYLPPTFFGFSPESSSGLVRSQPPGESRPGRDAEHVVELEMAFDRYLQLKELFRRFRTDRTDRAKRGMAGEANCDPEACSSLPEGHISEFEMRWPMTITSTELSRLPDSFSFMALSAFISSAEKKNQLENIASSNPDPRELTRQCGLIAKWRKQETSLSFLSSSQYAIITVTAHPRLWLTAIEKADRYCRESAGL